MTNEEIKQELAELEANDSNVNHELVSAIYERLDNDIDYTRVICKYNRKPITHATKGYITDSLEEIKIRLAIHSEPDQIVDTWYVGHASFRRFGIRGFDAENKPVSGSFAYILDGSEL